MLKRTFKRTFFAATMAAAVPLTACGERNQKPVMGSEKGAEKISQRLQDSQDVGSIALEAGEDSAQWVAVIDTQEASQPTFVELRHFDAYNNYRAMLDSARVETQEARDDEVAKRVSHADKASSTCSLRELILGD